MIASTTGLPRTEPHRRLVRSIRSIAHHGAAALAWALQGLAGLVIAVSDLVVPAWAQFGLAVGWLAGVYAMVATRRGAAWLLVPVATWLGMAAAVVIGDAWLGWTA